MKKNRFVYIFCILVVFPALHLQGAEPLPPLRERLVDSALQYTGCPYTLAGTTRDGGFDCLGLVYRVYLDEAGIRFPFLVPDLYARGASVEKEFLLPGDLLFFNTMGYVSHVGMYIGGGEFVHAENENTGVVVTSLSTPYYARTYAGARRYLQDTGMGGAGRFGGTDPAGADGQDVFSQFHGYFETSFGPMSIFIMDSYGNAKGVFLPEGSEDGSTGEIWGRIDVEKASFAGKWAFTGTFDGDGGPFSGAGSGDVVFYLTEDNKGLRGFWRESGKQDWKDTWNGTRKF